MNQRTINFVCLLLAVAGISFGVGQSVSPDASADPQASKVQKVKDSGVQAQLRILFGYQRIVIETLRDIEAQAHDTCVNVRYLGGPDTTNQRPCDPLGH